MLMKSTSPSEYAQVGIIFIPVADVIAILTQRIYSVHSEEVIQSLRDQDREIRQIGLLSHANI